MENQLDEISQALVLCAKASSAGPNWTAVITGVVAALGILIAYRQWASARD